MKRVLTVVFMTAAVAWAGAAPLEQSSADAQRSFDSAARISIQKTHAPAIQGVAVESGFTLEQPRLSPGTKGALLGSFVMAERLDVQRDMLTKQLGPKVWDIGIAGDAEFKVLYFTIRRPEALKLGRVNNLSDLRGKGVDFEIEPGVTYNTRVKIDIFDPVKNSTLYITPVHGTVGPSHQLKTGELLDRARAKSYIFNVGDTEYWCLYTTDVDTNTNQLANTRSIVFLHESGINSKAYHIAESSLTFDQPVNVALGSDNISVVRTSSGKLELYSSDSAR